ncbi:hypothetical protein PY257_12055 [Ramlibacter sp. H39-3-26]|uniref:hypothetical protein n=1 Tax=Curvibacter soli TaxID=3031331 RepID=UPI0023DAACCD|nr:hypothetical protein [Ramlibacter sp. H39-3-26]MDF1485905.1 hypothetical protein [Ramlibacter sp. H39-3-26]
MGLPDLLPHLLGFAAPAFGVAALLVPLTRVCMPNRAVARSMLAHVAINVVVNMAVLLGGLALFGADGKLLTYAALVLASATTQWLLLRGWR